MEQFFSRKHRLPAFFCAALLALAACVVEDDSFESETFTVIESQAVRNVAARTVLIQFSYRAGLAGDRLRYQWYESADGTTGTGRALYDEDTPVFITPRYTQKGIYYYYCTVRDAATGQTETSPVYSVAYTGLPIVYVNTPDGVAVTSRTEWTDGATISVLGAAHPKWDFTDVKTSIRGRGNSSWNMPKKGYNIKFDEKQKLFGLSKAKKWCLIANYADKSLLRNKFASILGNNMLNAVWNPSFVSVDVVMNGEYIGNYLLGEKITLTDGRIEIPDISDMGENLSAGGFILEVDARLDGDFSFLTERGVPFVLKDPDEVSTDIQARVRAVVQAAENALYSDGFKDEKNDSYWRNYIDEASAIDWFIVNEFTKNNDAIFFSSVYMYYDPEDEKLHLGPNWDFDISCGNINYNGCDNPKNWWIKNARWISRMFDDEIFIQRLKNRWFEVCTSIYSVINGDIQSLADDIAVSAEFNFMKWQILGRYTWPNAADYANRTTYQSEVDYMINWLNARYEWMNGEISDL